MAHEPPTIIKVTADSEIGKLIDAAACHPVLLEKDGAVYSLTPASSGPDDLWAGYDPKKVREAIIAYGGSWAELDADAMIDEIYTARKRGSRPANRP
jgi:hypothetical protein